MCRQIIIARGWYAILAALVFQLPVPQPVLSGASLNVREQEVYRPLDVNPTGVSRIGDNINEALAALTNIALNEKISRFASVGGADRKLDSFEAEVSIVDGVERYSSVRGRGRTYNHVSEIRGLWSFGEIVTMLRTTRDILDATVTNREGAKSPDSTVIRFWGASGDHRWFVTAGGRIYWLDFEGTIQISNRTGEIERLTWSSGAGPPGSGIAGVLWDVNFSVVNVGDIPCITPSDSIYRVVRTGPGRAAEWNRTQYAAVGRYGSTVNVRFEQ
jgi:hypothetical protein